MGKFAMYQRRGSVREVAPALAPPTPQYEIRHDDYYWFLSTAEGNAGGFARLYFSANPNGPWTIRDTVTRADTVQMFYIPDADTGYYACSEIGNGTDYQGESALSDVYHVTAPP